MISIKTQSNVGNARYFRDHLASGDYYSSINATPGQWYGAGAGMLGLSGQVSSLRCWGCLCHFPRWIWTFWTFSLHRRNILPLPFLTEGKKSPESPDSPLIPVFPMIKKAQGQVPSKATTTSLIKSAASFR